MKQLIFGIIAISLFLSCNNNRPADAKEEKQVKNVSIENKLDSLNTLLIAEKIVYDVKVKISSDDDDWTKECLANTNPPVLANIIFGAIYDSRLQAFDYYTNQEMSINEVKDFEKEWERDKIGKIQFMENWYFDETNLHFYKKVYGIMLAYERYNEDGSVKNYKAGIKVIL
jgi:hypothetical protein